MAGGAVELQELSIGVGVVYYQVIGLVGVAKTFDSHDFDLSFSPASGKRLFPVFVGPGVAKFVEWWR